MLQDPQASSTTKVTCAMPAKPPIGSDYYVMTMYVDGVKVPNTERFGLRYDEWFTPKYKEPNSPR